MSHHLDLRAHLVAPRRTDEDRTRADPLTRLERLECKVAARNHTIKLRSDCRLRRRCASTPALAFMVNCAWVKANAMTFDNQKRSRHSGTLQKSLPALLS